MNKQGLIDIINKIEETYYYKRYQFTIDLFDNELNEYINLPEDADEFTFLSALKYKLETVLEIMDTSLCDYFIIRSVVDAISMRVQEINLINKLEIDKQLMGQDMLKQL
jgi:hypothetical protein